MAIRKGEVWILENPTGEEDPIFTLFAEGLHEPLGLAWHDGALYTAQRSEVTRLEDADGDDNGNEDDEKWYADDGDEEDRCAEDDARDELRAADDDAGDYDDADEGNGYDEKDDDEYDEC